MENHDVFTPDPLPGQAAQSPLMSAADELADAIDQAPHQDALLDLLRADPSLTRALFHTRPENFLGACALSPAPVVQCLLDVGVDTDLIETRSSGARCLDHALENQDLDVFVALVNAGCSPDKKSGRYSSSPIERIFEQERTDLIDRLLADEPLPIKWFHLAMGQNSPVLKEWLYERNRGVVKHPRMIQASIVDDQVRSMRNQASLQDLRDQQEEIPLPQTTTPRRRI